ncbi:DNA modification methylase [Paenibacillus zanthoxyli]|uniref:DNA modification methylase n=1 Tax=Paenibacillus zanthoxyli TaxID=369399 RepID=UPI00046FA0D8|nr:DNA modification methylase [Paenibacillus zanthoxyli]
MPDTATDLVGNYLYTDYVDTYKSIMQFNKNKNKYIHGWYPFVEGYSKEFIQGIIDELPYTPEMCLEPFAGSGTTPMELQKMRIQCASFEVNPFMYEVATTKMRTDYTVKGFNINREILVNEIRVSPENIELHYPPPIYGRITEKDKLKKWNFNRQVLRGLLDIKLAICRVPEKKYRHLFRIALASILLEVSNVYRNGKCLSYKDNWQSIITYSRSEVHQIFLDRLNDVILPDIRKLDRFKKEQGRLFSNYKYCYEGDCRTRIGEVNDNSVDLVITSPPYLNSRDYTDSYMAELWMLDYIKSYDELKALRQRTLRSHVQVKWGEVELLNIPLLQKAVNEIEEHKEEFWNDEIPSMIKGYFNDLNTLFISLSKKVKPRGRIYFNVANSAYYGVEIKTDQIVSEIAELNGFKVREIRKARKLNPSVQQKEKIPYLDEVVIVLENN